MKVHLQEAIDGYVTISTAPGSPVMGKHGRHLVYVDYFCKECQETNQHGWHLDGNIGRTETRTPHCDCTTPYRFQLAHNQHRKLRALAKAIERYGSHFSVPHLLYLWNQRRRTKPGPKPKPGRDPREEKRRAKLRKLGVTNIAKFDALGQKNSSKQKGGPA